MNSNQSCDSEKEKPTVLYQIPEQQNNTTDNKLQSYLYFAFPNGLEISYNEKKPKIYAITLTNEQGNNSYMYILLFYDKINDTDKTSFATRNSGRFSNEIIFCPCSIILYSYFSNL